jgi:hypothetical protein
MWGNKIMNSRDSENLKDLFARFLRDEQAESSVEDIQKGEQILREHPAPEPDRMLLANIKAEMAMRLPSRRASRFSNTAYRIACAAATIIIISAIGLKLVNKNPGINNTPDIKQTASMLSTAVWVSDNIATADVELADYTVEIEQIEQELRALQSGGSAGNGESSLNELEMELVAINNDFWKE